MWWWATYYARPATDGEATAQARERLGLMLARLAAMAALPVIRMISVAVPRGRQSRPQVVPHGSRDRGVKGWLVVCR